MSRRLLVLRTYMAAQREICPEARCAEEDAAVGSAWWTFLLLIPVHLFATNPAFAELAAHAPEWRWAMYTGAVALLETVVWYVGTPVMRFFTVLGAMFVWEFIAVHLAMASPSWHHVPVNTGFGIYTWLAFKSYRAARQLLRFVAADGVQRLRRSRFYGPCYAAYLAGCRRGARVRRLVRALPHVGPVWERAGKVARNTVQGALQGRARLRRFVHQPLFRGRRKRGGNE